MRVLVTGGAGFIGSHLVKRLLGEGHSVTIIDNLSTGKRENLDSNAEFVELDVAQSDFIKKLPTVKFDAVCHLAAQSSGELSALDPLYDFRANAESTLALSRWCVKNGIPRFLYASSMAVYGNASATPVDEEAVCSPLSFYGVSKLASEYILRLAEREQLRSTSFRMFSVYGPGQNLENLKQGMVSIYLAYLLKDVPIPVTGSLERFRDFVYIDDVIDAWLRALRVEKTPSPIYNLGTGRATRVKELLRMLMETFGKPNHVIQEKAGSEADQTGLSANIGRAEKELGWRPRISLTDGLKSMTQWARSL